MDEGLLNDLLECSVCLERLDTSSRVLPCQHTFCLKCLKVIVESHKELRCPECRVLVEAKVEELPPNVLLMRILEGMRNQPRKAVAGPRTPRSGHSQGQPQSVQQSCREGKQLPPHARALYDYASKEMGDLSFKKGETILLQKKLDPFWYQGECSGRSGMFPITYVQVIIPLPNPTALCKALYDFRMSAPDEEGCLAFDKGAIISVHRRVDENWAEGRLEQRVGIFPIAFVELNHAARQLMNNVPLNRPVPSLPEQTRPGHSEHRHHAQHTHRYLPMSMSTPASTAGNYQNIATMSQSHPNYHNHPPPQLLQPQVIQPQIQSVQPQVTISTISHGGLLTTTAVPRNIIEPTQTKHSLDLIHFTNNKHPLLPNSDRVRLKFDSYNSTPVHKVDTTYQNVRAEFNQANLNNASSDSSSSMNTPSIGVSSMSTANTSSDTSTSESAEPSLPSSPDNNTERNATVIASTTIQAPEAESNAENPVLNASMGVLSINEGSTATNTSLNVSLPPTESPKNVVKTSQSQENLERLDVPSSSKTRHSGPDSLLNFGLGLQAALSPSHSKDAGYMAARTREHHREKRHSLTPSTHLQGRESTPNRHSAEILATSLLDHGVLERDRTTADRSRTERDRRRRRSRSNELALPATYVALYPYKPQKPDELELRKGGVYLVTERCRDGWYKGSSERSQRAGVFPGNYVTARPHSRKDKPAPPAPSPAAPPPPDAPPRTHSPPAQVPMYQWSQSPLQTATQPTTPRSEKCKDKKAEKSSLSSVMKRLTAMKKCKSPPAAYSMDNPVFDDAPGPSLLLNLPAQHQHVRSGSCPSQLLRSLPAAAALAGGATGERLRLRERAALAHDRVNSHRPTNEGPWQTQHRKSQSLDVTAAKRDKHPAQTVKERFRCIVPYPPNSEYELELKVDDIVLVSKKRGDGWYKGTLQRTGRTGLFPASFVQSCPE